MSNPRLDRRQRAVTQRHAERRATEVLGWVLLRSLAFVAGDDHADPGVQLLQLLLKRRPPLGHFAKPSQVSKESNYVEPTF